MEVVKIATTASFFVVGLLVLVGGIVDSSLLRRMSNTGGLSWGVVRVGYVVFGIILIVIGVFVTKETFL